MPKGLLQEKFQRTMPNERKENHEWRSFESVRRSSSMGSNHYTTSEAKKRFAGSELTDFDAPKTNIMPVGMGQKNVNVKDGGLAGSTDESNSVNAEMLGRGYQRQNMRPDDDMYTNEHVEEFYGDATVDGNTGFLERNNYLDRN